MKCILYMMHSSAVAEICAATLCVPTVATAQHWLVFYLILTNTARI